MINPTDMIEKNISQAPQAEISVNVNAVLLWVFCVYADCYGNHNKYVVMH